MIVGVFFWQSLCGFWNSVVRMNELENHGQCRLPEAYVELVIQPVNISRFAEPSAGAEREMGFDPQGACCYYMHRYTMTRVLLDDEDVFYEEVAYSELVCAWRLDDGRWLRFDQHSGSENACQDRRGSGQYRVGNMTELLAGFF